MGRPKIDLTGKFFNRLCVLYEDTHYIGKARKWVCGCTCGNKVSVFHSSLKANQTKSCGCLRKEYMKTKMTIHGKEGTRIYKIWDGIKQRIDNPNTTGYQYYGGRGITLCDPWRDFTTFSQWAYQSGYKEDLSIDRRNNDLGYCPENCRWVSRITQGRNQNKSRSNTSGFIGVVLIKKTGKWQASIRVNCKRIYLGNHPTAREAAIQRDTFIVSNKLTDFRMNGVL